MTVLSAATLLISCEIYFFLNLFIKSQLYFLTHEVSYCDDSEIKQGEATLLLERDEPGGVSGSNTWSSMLHWLIADGKLSQIMPNHLRLHNKTKAQNIQIKARNIKHSNSKGTKLQK